MKTMPRSSTMRPSGTWVDSTRRPARKAGQRISRLCSGMAGEPREEAADGVVVEAEEVFGLVGAADGEGEQHRRQMGLLADELRGARILIGGIDDHLRLTFRNVVE